MTTIEEIRNLVEHRDRERINLELKSIRKITEQDAKGDNRRDIAYEIAAIANKFGGKLLFGVNDDGTFDPKFEGNPDNIKEYIVTICHDMISPVIDCNINFVQSNDWSVFVVDIPQRRHMPHAVVPNRRSHEINSRIYYTRTPFGKKLANDIELEWMFKSVTEPIFEYDFRLCSEFTRNLESVGCHSDIILVGTYYFNNWLEALSEDDKRLILEEQEGLGSFLLELYPFLILKTLADYYGHHWYIGMTEGFDREGAGPMRTNSPIPTQFIDARTIPISGFKIANRLSWDLTSLIDTYFFTDNGFHVPPDTTVSIERSHRSYSEIKFLNPNFCFEIRIAMLGMGTGLHHKNPDYQIELDKYGRDAERNAREKYVYFDGAGYLRGTFDTPMYDIEKFKRYTHYFDTIKKILNKGWDFNNIINGVPERSIRTMHSKIDDILHLLSVLKIK
jgi:hypothetical protein